MRRGALRDGLIGIAAIGVLVMGAPAAHADGVDPTKVIVLEEIVSQPPAHPDALSKHLQDQFAGAGFITDPEAVADALGSGTPRPGRGDFSVTSQQILQLFDQGNDQWQNDDLIKAIRTFRHATTLYRHNPTLMAEDASNITTIVNGMAVLGFAEWKLSQKPDSAKKPDEKEEDASTLLADSKRDLQELALEFPDRDLSSAVFPPDLIDRYREAVQAVQQRGHGSLAINVTDADNAEVHIYVDGQLAGVNNMKRQNVPVGTHTVLLLATHDPVGRRYHVDVAANANTEHTVDWKVDSALWLTHEWSGFTVVGGNDRATEEARAGAIAARTAARQIVVVQRTTIGETPAVVGTAYDANGKIVHSDTVTLDKLPALINLLRGENAHPKSALSSSAPYEPVSHGHRPWDRKLGIGLVTAGGAGLVGGALMIAFGGPPHNNQPMYWDFRTPGYGVVAGGAVALGVGLYFLFRPHAHSAPVATVTSHGGYVGWATSF